MSVCGVAGRRRRSAVARVLVGIRNTSLFATALMCHFVPYISTCIAGEGTSSSLNSSLYDVRCCVVSA